MQFEDRHPVNEILSELEVNGQNKLAESPSQNIMEQTLAQFEDLDLAGLELKRLTESIGDETNLEDYIKLHRSNIAKRLFIGTNLMIVLTLITQSEIAFDATLLTGVLFACFAIFDVTQEFDKLIKIENHKRLITKAKELEAAERLGYKLSNNLIDPEQENDQKFMNSYSVSVTDRLEDK